MLRRELVSGFVDTGNHLIPDDSSELLVLGDTSLSRKALHDAPLRFLNSTIRPRKLYIFPQNYIVMA
jgi:hypothetical protein